MRRDEISKIIQSNQKLDSSSLHWIETIVEKIFEYFESRTCENCKFYQPETIKGTLFKRCFFLGTVGDIITCGRWEQR